MRLSLWTVVTLSVWVALSAQVVPDHCSGVECRMHCEQGFRKDTDGCPLCECLSDMCAEVQCPDGTLCMEFKLSVTGHKATRCVDPHLPSFCQHPMDPGPCRGAFERWAYNTDNGLCEQYVYGGCGGNSNNYATKENCSAKCIEFEGCSPAQCRMACPEGRFKEDKNGCRLCECELEEEVPTPSCVKLPASCVANCPGGLKKNSDGCDMCECTGSATGSDCSMKACRMFCEHGFRRGADGCEVCECNEAPVTCPDVMCHMYCANGFAKGADGCPVCRCAELPVPRSACAEPKLQCTMFCDHGFKKDSQGCDLCECAHPPVVCPEVACRMYCEHGFVKDVDGCDLCECADAPVPCPEVMCAMYCEHGFQKDENDCNVCRCRDSPADCLKAQCAMACEYGFTRDESGCANCECLPNPCQAVECPEFQKCVVVDNEAHGMKQPQCIESKAERPWCATRGICRMACEHGFLTDKTGCDVCRCRNTSKPECAPAACRMFCRYGFKFSEDGCRQCSCLRNPCQEMTCVNNTVCEAKEPEDCPLCPTISTCIAVSEVQRMRVRVQFAHEPVEDFDDEEFMRVLRMRVSMILSIDKEYIKGIRIMRPNDYTTVCTFHVVSYGSTDLVQAFDKLRMEVRTHQRDSAVRISGSIFVPEHNSLMAEFSSNPEYREAEDTVDEEDEDEEEDNTTLYIIIGCSVAGGVALITLIVVIVCVTQQNKKKTPPSKHVSYSKSDYRKMPPKSEVEGRSSIYTAP